MKTNISYVIQIPAKSNPAKSNNLVEAFPKKVILVIFLISKGHNSHNDNPINNLINTQLKLDPHLFILTLHTKDQII